MLPERPRIFLGTEDVGLCMSALSDGLREHGCETTTMVTHKEFNAPNAQYDVLRGPIIKPRVNYELGPRAIAAIARRFDAATSLVRNAVATPSYLDHDVFLFFWKLWAPEPAVLPLLRRLGKKIVFYYLGSDVRHVSALAQEYDVDVTNWGSSFHKDPLVPKIERLRWVELYSDLVYSVPDQSGLQIRPYYHAHVPLRVDLEPHVPSRKRPLVVHSPAFHAPTRGDIKGSSFVYAAVEQLKREGLDFEFKVITQMTRSQVLDVLRDADILIDELFLHGPGGLSAEGLRAGCAVATRIIEPPFPFFDAPVCPIRPETVLPALRRLITDIPYRVALAAKGPGWAEKEFSPREIAANILRHLRGEVLPEYVPDFYLSRYRPPVKLSRLAKSLSLRVAERFRPEMRWALDDAVRRGVIDSPSARRARLPRLFA